MILRMFSYSVAKSFKCVCGIICNWHQAIQEKTQDRIICKKSLENHGALKHTNDCRQLYTKWTVCFSEKQNRLLMDNEKKKENQWENADFGGNPNQDFIKGITIFFFYIWVENQRRNNCFVFVFPSWHQILSVCE